MAKTGSFVLRSVKHHNAFFFFELLVVFNDFVRIENSEKTNDLPFLEQGGGAWLPTRKVPRTHLTVPVAAVLSTGRRAVPAETRGREYGRRRSIDGWRLFECCT